MQVPLLDIALDMALDMVGAIPNFLFGQGFWL